MPCPCKIKYGLRKEVGKSGQLKEEGFWAKPEVWRARMVVHSLFLPRSLILKCSSYRQARWWAQEITELAQGPGRDFIQLHRHDSYAPPRPGTLARW